jgi:ubiquinone/menaquinone biosynthesis C-methylase UbiE
MIVFMKILEFLDEILANFSRKSIYSNYLKSLDLRKGANVLEVGCGSGNFSLIFARHFFPGSITSFDISNFKLSFAKKRGRKYKNLNFKLGRIEDLDLKNSFYDYVFVHYVLHDIKNEEQLNALKEIRKKIKGSCTVFMREPTSKTHGLSEERIKSLMAMAGFVNIYSKKKCNLFGKRFYEGVFKKN